MQRKAGVDARHADFRQRLRAYQRAEILYPTSLPIRRWTPIVCAVMLLLVAWTALLRSPHVAVTAEELLARAAHEETSPPAGAIASAEAGAVDDAAADRAERVTGAAAQRPIRIRLEPPVGLARGPGAFAPVSFSIMPGAAVARDFAAAGEFASPVTGLYGDAAMLFARVEQLGLDPRRPLSVAGLRAWRARSRALGLRDTVTFDARRSQWVLRTFVREGPIRVVEVVATWDAYHVVRQTMVAEGLGRVTVEEIRPD